MVRRRVELPDVARRCWPNAIELVETLTKECATLEHEAWYLGGGTALAADWKHRTSTDIDILIAPGLSISALGPEANARIDRVIERQHGQRLAAPDQKLTVKYEQGGKVDIFSSGRQLPGHEEAIEVDGMPAQRLSDAQIFAGKLRRAIEGQPAARDLFDICYATKTGRRGFEQAVNALTGDEQRRIVVLWETAGGKIVGEARTNLAGIKELDRIPPEKLAKRAATALREHRYARTIIRAGRGRAVVRTRTFSGEWRDYESTTETARRDFEARGVNRYLASQNIRPDQVTDKVLKHIDNREMVEIRQIERRLSARDASGPGAPERPTPAGTGHRGGQTGPPRSTSGTRTGPGDR